MHFCTSDSFVRRVNFARVLILRRNGSELHKDIFARADTFARRVMHEIK